MKAEINKPTGDRHELLQRWNRENLSHDFSRSPIRMSEIRMADVNSEPRLPKGTQSDTPGKKLNLNPPHDGQTVAGKSTLVQLMVHLAKRVCPGFHKPKPEKTPLPMSKPVAADFIRTPPIPFKYPVEIMRPLPTPLARVVDRFNQQFGYELHLPVHRETMRSAATLAELYGQPELAEELRAVLAEPGKSPEDFNN
jgi:hypothetical protein